MNAAQQPRLPVSMLMMHGSTVVCFGINADNATTSQRARLVESGMSIRVLHPRGQEVGPVFAVPTAWLQQTGTALYFSRHLTFRHWSGPRGEYRELVLRMAPCDDNRHYVPPGWLTIILGFRPVTLGPREIATVVLPTMRIT